MDPGTITDAAVAGDILRLALIVSLTLVGVLSTGVWILMRERAARRERQEDLLDRRLSDGTKKMREICDAIDGVQRTVVALAGSTVSEADCKDCKARSEAKHDKLEASVMEFGRDLGEIRLEVRELATRINEKFGTMIQLLGKVLVIQPPSDERDGSPPGG